jgi:hypothetical protein
MTIVANGDTFNYDRGGVVSTAELVGIAAGTASIGEVTLASQIVYSDVTLSLDTGGAYFDGDVLAATQTVSNGVRIDDEPGLLQNIVVVDQDDQGIALDLVFLSASVSIGTENSAVSISDADALNICGIVSVSAGDFKDLGGVKVATLSAVGLSIKPLTGTNDFCVAAISRGAGTYTASGIKLRLGVICN